MGSGERASRILAEFLGGHRVSRTGAGTLSRERSTGGSAKAETTRGGAACFGRGPPGGRSARIWRDERDDLCRRIRGIDSVEEGSQPCSQYGKRLSDARCIVVYSTSYASICSS